MKTLISEDRAGEIAMAAVEAIKQTTRIEVLCFLAGMMTAALLRMVL